MEDQAFKGHEHFQAKTDKLSHSISGYQVLR